MKKTPDMMITPKDRLYISDILGVANVYAKKCRAYQEIVKDEEVNLEIGEFHDTLTSQYDELLQLLEEETI
jgi:hypothetical protein